MRAPTRAVSGFVIAVLASGGFFARIGAGQSETGYTPDQA